MYPQLFAKQPPKEHDSWFSEALHALVDIAATVIGFEFGIPIGGFLINGALGAGLLTTVADMGYQELAVHEGWQASFDLKSSLAVGIEAGISSSIIPPVNGSAAAGAGSGATSAVIDSPTDALVIAIRKAGEIAVFDQLTNMALGQQNGIDFNAIVASMLTAATMQKIGLPQAGDYQPNQSYVATADQLIKGFINNIGGGFIEGFTHSELARQNLNVELIAASALGSTAGQELGEALASEASLGSSKATAAGNNNGANNVNGSVNNNASGGSIGGVSPGSPASVNGANNGTVNSSLTNNPGSGSGSAAGNLNGTGSAGNGNQNNSQTSGDTNNQSAQNPGRNINGFFSATGSSSSGSGNNLAQAGSTANNGSIPQAGQITPASGAGASYGQGNSALTSKMSANSAVALLVGDAEAFAATPMSQLLPSINLPGSVPDLSTILQQNPNLSVVGQGTSGYSVYDKSSIQYLAYDPVRGLINVDTGIVEPVSPESWIIQGVGGIGLIRSGITLAGLAIDNSIAKTLSSFSDIFSYSDIVGTGDDTADSSVPGLGRPFRSPNPTFPANQNVIQYMNSSDFQNLISNPNIDCSEIADQLFGVSNGSGNILKITPIQGQLNS